MRASPDARRWYAPVVSLLLAACSAAPPTPGVSPQAADVQLPLAPYFRELRTVRAVVGGDTLTLLLDTGGGVTAISPAVAARHGCTPAGRDVGFRMTGERVDFARCPRLEMALGELRVRFAPVAVFDLAALLPKELPSLDGVLALDAFRGRVITIDWPARRLTIHGAWSGEGAAPLPVRFATGQSGRFLEAFVRVDGPKDSFWLQLDSGNIAGTIVATHVPLEELGVKGDSGTTVLRVGGIVDYRARITQRELVIDGSLGTDFLMQAGAIRLDLRGAR